MVSCTFRTAVVQVNGLESTVAEYFDIQSYNGQTRVSVLTRSNKRDRLSIHDSLNFTKVLALYSTDYLTTLHRYPEMLPARGKRDIRFIETR